MDIKKLIKISKKLCKSKYNFDLIKKYFISIRFIIFIKLINI